MLPRILEPELMDTAEDAQAYDEMDHGEVNAQYAIDLLAAIASWRGPQRALMCLLDLGTGTAQIPIELCRRDAALRVVAVDAAESMLATAGQNVEVAGLADRIELVLGDAKRLPFDSDRFPVVVSNSILHHLAEPALVIAELLRVAAPGALLFHRDLARPANQQQIRTLVATYATEATPYQQKLLADSLHAALTLEEAQSLVSQFGFAPSTVQMTSDRHWTWHATNSGA